MTLGGNPAEEVAQGPGRKAMDKLGMGNQVEPEDGGVLGNRRGSGACSV